MMVCWSYFYVRLCTYIHGVSVQLKTDELAEIPFLKKKEQWNYLYFKCCLWNFIKL